MSSPCDECPLNAHFLPAEGSPTARFLVVVKAPTRQQYGRRQNITAGASRLFATAMQQQGFTKDDFLFTNAVRCAYDPSHHDRKERQQIEKCCRQHLVALIQEHKPEVIIPLGAEAAKAVQGRAVKITKVRGIAKFSEEHQAMVLPTTDPSYVYRYPQHEPLFNSDCATLGRLVDYDYDLDAVERDTLGNYRMVRDIQFLVDRDPEFLAFDTETLGLRWQEKGNKIMTLQFCTRPGEAFLVPWDHPDAPLSSREKNKIRNQLKTLLQNPRTRVVSQNGKFDALWIYDRLGIRYRIDQDTLMLYAEMDENSMSKDLDTLTKMYVPAMAGYADAFNLKWDKSRMDLVPLDEIVGYGCGDVDANLRVFFELEREAKQDPKIWNHYRRVAMPAINAFIAMEHRGLRINEDALDVFEVVLAEYVEELRRDILSQIPRSIKREHAKAGLSLTRDAFLRDVLFFHKDGFRLEPRVFTKGTKNLRDELKLPSISSKDHLPFFMDDDNAGSFVTQLSEWKKLDRLLGTNVRRFRENYIVDGKIHPIYSLWVAVTGRTASRDPNGQNFPKRGKQAKAYRDIFVPPPGYVLLEADLSQAELRIAANMARDPTMLHIYNTGGDIHKYTACIVMGVSMEQFESLPKDEQDLARFKAKAVNFGFLYGMGWRKFIIYAKTQYGVEFDENEAQRIRYGFFQRYGGLLPWHDSIRSFVHTNGYVRSYSGRTRHLPMVWSQDEGVQAEAVRQGINSPVQNFASDLGVMSLSRLDQEIDPKYLAIVGFVHDALYAYVPEEYVEWGAKMLKHYMETNPLQEWFDLQLELPIIADVSFGWSGGKMHEMKGLALDEDFDFEAIAWDEEKQEYKFDLVAQEIPPGDGYLEEYPYELVDPA